MTNGDNGGDLMGEILRSLSSEYGWKDYKPLEKEVAEVSPDVLTKYAGKYQFSPELIVTVIVEDGHLFVDVPEEGRTRCYPESESTFFMLDDVTQISFLMDPSGEVTHMSAIPVGEPVKGKRIESP